jgi:hypothetical protein
LSSPPGVLACASSMKRLLPLYMGVISLMSTSGQSCVPQYLILLTRYAISDISFSVFSAHTIICSDQVPRCAFLLLSLCTGIWVCHFWYGCTRYTLQTTICPIALGEVSPDCPAHNLIGGCACSAIRGGKDVLPCQSSLTCLMQLFNRPNLFYAVQPTPSTKLD